jgi:hypothetical protein
MADKVTRCWHCGQRWVLKDYKPLFPEPDEKLCSLCGGLLDKPPTERPCSSLGEHMG